MAVATKIDPIDRDIAVIIDQDLSPEAQSRYLADFARQSFAEAEAQNRAALGETPPHETFVDGRKGAPIEAVRPDGTIVFEFDLVTDVLEWIGEQLVHASPVLTGRYAASHILFADDVAVEPGQSVPAAEEYAFINTQPYARKIERGLSAQAPDGVYQAVAAVAAKRFGNVARVRFSYRSLRSSDTHLEEWASRTSLTRPGRRMSEAARDEWLRRQPAVIVRTF
ncbi:MAG: hypothetical protein ACTHJ3_07670 [Pararhizobium sp.]